MGPSKKRLYIAIYPTGITGDEQERYHFSFVIGPKREDHGNLALMRYYVKDVLGRWEYEEVPLSSVRSSVGLLARVVIAKIRDEARLVDLMRSVPVVQGDRAYWCGTWIAQVLEAVERDGSCVGTAVLDWGVIEHVARDYVESKIREGRYSFGADMTKPKLMYDLLDRREVVP